VAERGFAIDDEENERNIRCVGAAVRDGHGPPTGAVSVSALTLDLTLDDVPRVGRRVMSAADELSRALSGAPSAVT
jgi:IclR family transcriptional regulator, acetate operon repressor